MGTHRKFDFEASEVDEWRLRLHPTDEEMNDLIEESEGFGYGVTQLRLVESLRQRGEREEHGWAATARGRDGRYAANSHRERARRFGVGASLTNAEWRVVIGVYEGKCVYCETSFDLVMDHIRPMSRGGDHSVWNVAPACHSCNTSKRALLLADWLLWRNDLDTRAIEDRICNAREKIEKRLALLRESGHTDGTF